MDNNRKLLPVMQLGQLFWLELYREVIPVCVWIYHGEFATS